MEKLKGRWVRGSFLIEAMVVTFVFLCLVMEFVLISFFLHDKCLLESASYEVLATLVVPLKKEEDLKQEEVIALFQERVANKMLVLREVKGNVVMRKGEVMFLAEGRFRGIRIRHREKMPVLWIEKKLRRVREIKKKGEAWKDELP